MNREEHAADELVGVAQPKSAKNSWPEDCPAPVDELICAPVEKIDMGAGRLCQRRQHDGGRSLLRVS